VFCEKPWAREPRARHPKLASTREFFGKRISRGAAEEIDSKGLPSVRTGPRKGKKRKRLWYAEARYAISGTGVPQYPPNCLQLRVFLGQLRQRMC
jgi:hypothetical protein